MGSGLCFGDWVVTVTQDEFLDLIRLADWRMANPWTQSIVITLPKKGNLQQRQNYRTINLISHPSKVMLQAEKIVDEEQAGFRAGRSTTEQIFNLRILCEKYLQHQQDLYHVFIHRLQEGLRQGLACSFGCNHEEVQHQHQPYLSHQKPL